MLDSKSLLLSAIPSILILVDEQGRIKEWNLAAQETFGINQIDALGKTLEEINIKLNIKMVTEGIREAFVRRKPYLLDEIRHVFPEGKQGILGITLIPVFEQGQEPLGCILLGAEITDRKRLDNQQAHAQKMESIGQLAAGIAHEINTPIQYVGDNIRFLEEAFADLGRMLDAYDALLQAAPNTTPLPVRSAEIATLAEELDLEYLRREIPRSIEQSLEGVQHVARIVRAMRQFSHPDTQEKTMADLNAAIESTVTVSRNEWKYVSELELALDPTLPMVPCLLGDFNQVLLNIIINAAHAIADRLGRSPERKGRITISTHHDGDWVELRISDTGTGIPEAIRARVFDPFFTTKEVGKGTGQGLSLAYSTIVEKHAGQITFETQQGEGTTFIIRLPLAELEPQG